jgi:uncharacterized damage-inducible protein DinB
VVAATDEIFLRSVRTSFADVGKRLAAAVGRLGPADVNWWAAAGSNSVANLVHHICGNAHQRIVSNIGGAQDTRNREAEFAAPTEASAEQLVRLVEDTFRQVDAVLATLPADRLLEAGPRGYGSSHLETLHFCLGHVREHLGQVILIAKQRLGSRWEGFSA